jgi:hypothetical protein
MRQGKGHAKTPLSITLVCYWLYFELVLLGLILDTLEKLIHPFRRHDASEVSCRLSFSCEPQN